MAARAAHLIAHEKAEAGSALSVLERLAQELRALQPVTPGQVGGLGEADADAGCDLRLLGAVPVTLTIAIAMAISSFRRYRETLTPGDDGLMLTGRRPGPQLLWSG